MPRELLPHKILMAIPGGSRLIDHSGQNWRKQLNRLYAETLDMQWTKVEVVEYARELQNKALL